MILRNYNNNSKEPFGTFLCFDNFVIFTGTISYLRNSRVNNTTKFNFVSACNSAVLFYVPTVPTAAADLANTLLSHFEGVADSGVCRDEYAVDFGTREDADYYLGLVKKLKRGPGPNIDRLIQVLSNFIASHSSITAGLMSRSDVLAEARAKAIAAGSYNSTVELWLGEMGLGTTGISVHSGPTFFAQDHFPSSELPPDYQPSALKKS